MKSKKKFKIFFWTIVIVSLFYVIKSYSFQHINVNNSINNIASVKNALEDNPVSLNDINTDYGKSASVLEEKANILIVPGHEPGSGGGGAEFGSVYERNLVVEIGQDLQQFLQTNPRYNVNITRDNKSWNLTFADYFKNNLNDIIAWEKTAKQTASKLVYLGAKSAPIIIHNTAPVNIAVRLYGITKWANENNIDLMIHLHLNDYPGHSTRVAGIYSGLVIYTPAIQYSNSATTKDVANAVFKRLALYNPISNFPLESSGMIDDPELIAVGAYNTSDVASMLIEYGYIYEPQFVNPKVRSLALKDLAYQTYLGLQDFFTKNNTVSVTSSYDPASLYIWNTPVKDSNSNPEDIYAMQTALIMDGDFPPTGKSRNECPHSGTFGSCTASALKLFQKKYKIVDENSIGQKTFSLLNSIYTKQKN